MCGSGQGAFITVLESSRKDMSNGCLVDVNGSPGGLGLSGSGGMAKTSSDV
jgi:hypothetical protein